MTKIRLDIEYDCAGFAGWAKQPGQPTIEGALEAALKQIFQEPVRLSVAGRTDAGVHARGQVASFTVRKSQVDSGKIRRSLNRMLPGAIAVTSASQAAPEFDARRSARSRTYSYTVLNRTWPDVFQRHYVYFYPGRLDLQALNRAAAQALGRHDFTAFTPTSGERAYFQREVARSSWRRDGDLLIYTVTSDSFLHNMVRVLVGTMLEIGRGYRRPETFPALLAGAGRPDAGVTAPACGLCLEEVEYWEHPAG